MPAVFVETNAQISNPDKLASKLSKIVADGLKKPEKYVTVSIRKSLAMTRGGIPTKFVYVEIRSIGGLALEVNNSLSQNISEIFINIGFDKTKIDLNFLDVAPHNWGKFNGTFGN